MSYIDTSKITDRHAKTLIEKDSDLIADALWNAEKDTKSLARFHNVKSTDIPLEDGTGDLPAGALTSEPLYCYCEYRFLYHLFSGVWGAAAGRDTTDDIYQMKMELADRNAKEAKSTVTRATILSEDNEVIDRKERSNGIAIL